MRTVFLSENEQAGCHQAVESAKAPSIKVNRLALLPNMRSSLLFEWTPFRSEES